MKPSVLLIALVACTGLALPGCATSRSYAASKVKDADERMVSGCSFLGEVQGSSLLGGHRIETAVRNAKNMAAESAARMGATFVLWKNVESNAAGTFAFGRAYKCAGESK